MCVHRPRHGLKGLREKIRWQYLNIPRRHFLTHARNPHKGWWLHRKGPESRRGPSDSWHLSEIILSRTTIRGVLVGLHEREQESHRDVCWCVCRPGREKRVKLTYDKFNALLPVLPSFLPALTPMAQGHAGYYYFHSFPHVCLSVCLLCLTVWLYHLTPSSSTELFSDVFCPPTSPNGSNHLPPSNLFPRTRSYFCSFLSFSFFGRNTWLRILEDIGTAFVRRKDSSSYGIRFLCFGQPPLHQWLFIILK